MLGLAVVSYGTSMYTCVYMSRNVFQHRTTVSIKGFYEAPYASYLVQLTILTLKSGFEYNTRAPSSSFMGCWQAGRPQLAVCVLAEPPYQLSSYDDEASVLSILIKCGF